MNLLKGKVAENGLNMNRLAEAIGLNRDTLYRRLRNDGERRADFIRCVAWGKLGECIARYMKKGCLIGIEGRLQVGSYKDKEGVTRRTSEVVVVSADFLSGRQEAAPAAAESSARAEASALGGGSWRNTEYGVVVEYDEDLPW